MKRRIFQTIVVLMTVLIAGVSAYFASGLRIEQDNESMQSNQAKQDPVYSTYKRAFDSEYELMLTITRENVCDEAKRPQLINDIKWLSDLDGVKSVFIPPTLESGSGFVSDDRQTLGLLITLEPEQSREDRLYLLDTLRTQAPRHIPGTVRVVGLPLLKESVARHIAYDQSLVMPLSILVMTLFLALLFRRMAGIVIPMLVVSLSLVSTLGLYTACGFELNSITSLLPPVVIVLAVSVAVHLFDAWNHECSTGARGPEAVRAAVSHVWKPCIFTAAMTAVGLLSLCLSPVPAVRLFGLFSAIGVTFSVFFAFTILPIAMSWITYRTKGKTTLLNRFLHGLSSWPTRWPKVIIATAVLITLTSLWFATKVENNTDLIQFFKKSDPTYIAHTEVNRTLGSVRSFDLLLSRTDDAPFNPQTDLSALNQFVEKVEQIPDVVRTDSIAGISPTAEASPALMNRLLADEGTLVRVQVHLGDIGSARAAIIIEQIQHDAVIELGPDWLVQPTGDYYQVVRDSNQLVSTLLQSFAISLLVVMGSTCLLFRSIRVLLPAFIPNILPVIWGAGLMGLLGIDLSTGTTMIAAVVIGLAVDDTIHYLHHFQTFKHLPIREATRSTTRRIGHALTISSIVLVGGFWMGAFGSFIPTNTFALLTGCMMISALFCDLLVLPSFLILTTREGSPHD